MTCNNCNANFCKTGKDCYPDNNAGILSQYQNEDLEMAKIAAAVEADYYMKATRIEELRYFSERMGYKKIGLASCIGLRKEAQYVVKYLEQFFETHLIICKNGSFDKEELGLDKQEPRSFESMCNPIGQAKFLNDLGTDLNVIVGLCIGHDILFQKYSQAPVTTLIVKDRVLGHNPIAAIYSGYYKKILFK